MNRQRRLALSLEDIGTRNAAMARCLKLARLAAAAEVPILICGESGTGKTLLAQAIHNSSARAAGPFISFVASAMSDTLLESQLFGHERGAFTGAHSAMRGKFERADSGTLFLDEIADMSLLAQAKTLRAVECGEFERLGSERSMHSNARIVSATNRSLRDLIAKGEFREDLYHRLNGLTLRIPPLRDRPEDLPAIIAGEIRAAATECGKVVAAIHPAAMDKLMEHRWPGNLRELHHTVRTMLLLSSGPVITPDDIQFDEVPVPVSIGPAPTSARSLACPAEPDLSLARAVREHIRHVCSVVQGSQRKAAAQLGISRATLIRHLQKNRGTCERRNDTGVPLIENA